MFGRDELDDNGEIPAPFSCVEKHNFNPHRCRGDFEFDENGKVLIEKNPQGQFVDKRGSLVSPRGYRLDD